MKVVFIFRKWTKRKKKETNYNGQILLDNGLNKSFICGGARGVMVIVAGCGHDDTSSDPGRA